jgi:hypothetical protein
MIKNVGNPAIFAVIYAGFAIAGAICAPHTKVA